MHFVAAPLIAIGLCASSVRATDSLTVVPFRFVHHEILMNVMIGNGGPYTFLLDTGTTPTVIDASLAKRAGLLRSGRAGTGSDMQGGSLSVYPVALTGVRAGSLRLASLAAIVTDLSGFSNPLGVRLSGILGSNFFDSRVVQIDYPCRTVAVLSDAPLDPFTAHFEETPSGWIATGDAWAEGRRIVATIDTGNSGTPVVSRRGIATLHLQAAARNGKQTGSISYGGQHHETSGVLHDLEIGNVRLGNVATRFLTSGDVPFDLNVGNRTLEERVVTFDYLRGLLTIGRSRCAVR